MTSFNYIGEDIVVVVGSGSGDGTRANELCQRGIKNVVLEYVTALDRCGLPR